MSSASLPDYLSAAGAVAGGVAAVYVAFVGMRQYRDSLRLRAAATLADIEKEFRAVLGTLAQIEDDGGFESFEAALKKEANNTRLTEEELAAIVRLDLVLRFFYLFEVRRRWLPELSEMTPIYKYYTHANAGILIVLVKKSHLNVARQRKAKTSVQPISIHRFRHWYLVDKLRG